MTTLRNTETWSSRPHPSVRSADTRAASGPAARACARGSRTQHPDLGLNSTGHPEARPPRASARGPAQREALPVRAATTGGSPLSSLELGAAQ